MSGVPQVLGPATGGHYESVLTSGGITYLGAGNGLVYAFQSSGGKLLWQRNLISCPMLQYAPPGTLATLARDAAGTLVRMTFTGQMSYDAALDETINLGFRLTEKGFSPPHATPFQRQW